MRSIVVVLLLGTAMALAQQAPAGDGAETPAAPEQAQANPASPSGPSYSDLYCSGFVSRENISRKNTVMAGRDTPEEGLYAEQESLFVDGGGLQQGSQYMVIRELQDINTYEPFPGQRKTLAAAGQPYGELARVRVVDVHGDVAVTKVEFSCEPIAPGDLVVPFTEQPALTFKPSSRQDEFSHAAKVDGQVVMAKDFGTMAGTGEKVYLNVGVEQGLKPGDYVRAVRDYSKHRINDSDAVSYQVPQGDDSQKQSRQLKDQDLEKLPRRVVGEMLVLKVMPGSATAMITFARESVHVGDGVEIERQ